MRSNNSIQVFEHDHLMLKEQGFEKPHWEALGWYNEMHCGRFFNLTPKGVKFNQYVGVIQVNNLTIEVLPKIGRLTGKSEKAKWQKVLIDMLRECRWMSIHSNEKASLRFKPNSILEAYLELFIHECEEINRSGLVKKYRTVNNNCTVLKGKLLFHKQIQKNLVHKERFFTKYHIFDRNNLFNQILLKALRLIPVISQSPYLKDRVYSLLLSFPELEDISVCDSIFENLVFNRKTSRYKEAIEIAAMLLLNYRPDISSGRNHVLAILFDMNDLWEEFIYRQLAKSANKPPGWSIRPQNSKQFWKLNNSNRTKTIRPDIVITDNNNRILILDTKWKLPDKNIPDDLDLKQMFVYNEYWGGEDALLLYPHASFTKEPVFQAGAFSNKNKIATTHSCGIMKMSVLDSLNQQLDLGIGKRINLFLKEKILI